MERNIAAAHMLVQMMKMYHVMMLKTKWKQIISDWP